MGNVAAYKEIGEGFIGEEQIRKFTWDFSQDGGAQGTFTLGTVSKKIVVTQAFIHVETACAGATATVKIGFTTADDDAILNTTSGAVANLTDDVTDTESAASLLVVGAGDTLDMVIATADLTAGKINVYVKYHQVD
jgi:hypothetical protein